MRLYNDFFDSISQGTITLKSEEPVFAQQLYRELTAYGYQIVEPKGAFYMFPKCPIPDDKAFCQAAKKYRILIVPGSTFMGPGYFRLAFCVSEKTVLDSLEGFRLLAHEYGMN